MKKKGKIIALICLALVFILGLGSVLYVSDYYRADDTAAAAMAYEGSDVQIEKNGNMITFMPEDPTYGLIFYPGGKVQCKAYAPLLLECAKKGIACVLLKMPGNLAVLKPGAADGVQEKYPKIRSWYIGGHFLGGAMAASYVSKHVDEYDGLILLAAYSTSDLSKTQLKVLSIYGSEDGVLNRESYEKNRGNLPENFEEEILDGGCHGYFGCYGAQKGDGVPKLTNQEQVQQTAEYIENMICKEK